MVWNPDNWGAAQWIAILVLSFSVVGSFIPDKQLRTMEDKQVNIMIWLVLLVGGGFFG